MNKIIISMLAASLAVAALLSPFASSFPDGLEKVAEGLGFIEKGEVEAALKAPMPDYQLPFLKNEKISTSLAGVLGTLAVFGASAGIAKIACRKK